VQFHIVLLWSDIFSNKRVDSILFF